VLLEPAELTADGTAVVTGRRATHIAGVHQAAPGKSLRVGVIGGRIGQGVVRSVSEQEVVFEVTLDEEPPPDPGLDLIVALPRPKVLRRVLAMAASMGVRRLVLVNAFRVEKSYFDSPLLAAHAMREELVLGLEQGRDTVLPEILIRPRFKPFVGDELDALWPPPTTRLLPHPTARQSLRALELGPRTVVAIGPEGGWLPYEVSLLEARGFEPISLGARILRVETAIAFVAGQVAVAR